MTIHFSNFSRRAIGAAGLVLLASGVACSAGQDGSLPGQDDGAGTPGAAPSLSAIPETAELFADTGPVLNIVAHEDDDIGLMSPTLINDLTKASTPVRTIFLTTGDAGFLDGTTQNPCQAYAADRASGSMAAYAKMLGVASPHWTRTLKTFTINGNPKYMALYSLDGTSASLGFLALPNANSALQTLWFGNTTTTISTELENDGRPATNTYTRAELVEMLRLIMVDFSAFQINTLDSSETRSLGWPDDHTDHVHSALFAMAASQRYVNTHSLRLHRAYNIQFENDNVATADSAIKGPVFDLYATFDPKICTDDDILFNLGMTQPICGNEYSCDDPTILYDPFKTKMYPTPILTGFAGPISGPGGECLQAASTTTSGAAVTLATCNPTSNLQNFTQVSDGTIQLSTGGHCLTAVTPAGGNARNVRTVGLTVATCTSNNPDQKFMVTGDVGQLRGPDATCVSASGSTLTMQECSTGSATQGYFPRFYNPVYTATATGFTTTDIPNSDYYWGSIGMADVNGDTDSDVCVRKSGGIYCSLYNTSTNTLGAPVLGIAKFRDADGWNDSTYHYGSDIQYAQIDAAQGADVCGRYSDGIYCASANGGGTFTGYAKRSTTGDFTNTKYGSGPQYYRSVRLTDVTGDGKADVCGRVAGGIECAVNDGTGHFKPAALVDTEEFTDANGWGDDSHGSTIMFGDVDGDGKMDVCGRGALGVTCSLGNGTATVPHFDHSHLWTSDFGDTGGWNAGRAYYSSLRLVDINHDGKADLCGRGTTGLVCAVSEGSMFSPIAPVLTANTYNDSDGWGADAYGSTINFGAGTTSLLVYVCGRGPVAPNSSTIGVRCSWTYSH